MTQRLAAAVLAAAALAACATVSGTSEVLSLDSNPRGARVYATRDAAEPLGVTPLFVEERRARSHAYFLAGPDDSRLGHTLGCGLRWAPTFVGNGLVGLFFVAASPVIGLATLAGALGVDFLDGAAYTCAAPRKFAVPWRGEPRAPRCRRYLVMPPAHWDETVSDRLAREWVREARKELNGCAEFVSAARTKSLLVFLNVDHAHPTTYAELGERNARSLGVETGATDLVLLNPRVAGGTAQLDAVIYDLHTGVPDSAPPPPVEVRLAAGGAAAEPAMARSTIIRSVQLLPNSITYAVPYDSITFIAKPAFAVGQETRYYSLPKYATNIGASSVDHPDGFGVWDVHVHLYPGFTAGYIDESFAVGPKAARAAAAEPPPPAPFRYDLSFFYFAAVMNGAVTFHTPMGAVSPNVGLGAAAFAIQDTFEHVTALEPVGKAGLMYVAFVTQNVFLRANYDRYRVLLTGPLIDNQVLSLSSFQVASLGVGYFFPQLRSYARRLL